MRLTLSVLLLGLPWVIRRVALNVLFGYKIHPTARIGFSLIYPERLDMGPKSRIGNLTICKGLELLQMRQESSIGNLNWITGFPLRDKSFFGAESERRPELIVERHAAITNRHFIDCTNSVHLGEFATFAGIRSQLLTHSIDLANSQQSSKPVSIGKYCFVGTGSILLSGSTLPDYSVLGANSVLNRAYEETHVLYAGNPARAIKTLPRDTQYFLRTRGVVH